ncbi:MAG: hypothetical protein GX572_05810, partial [Clostridia bacterium]|nr:hypothetical protein [Clostridia bacterium]
LESKQEPEIIKIVFNEDAPIDEEGIKQAIAKAKAEAEAKRAAQALFSEENALTPEPAAMEEPVGPATAVMQELPGPAPMAAPEIPAQPSGRRIRRGHGLPQLAVETQNNDFELSELNFNINIKIP